jgi:RecA-family ATPase
MSVNVLPIRNLSEASKKILDRIEFAGEIPPVLDRNYLIKGWLDRGSVSVVYGDANVGKSFWALDLAHHIHDGLAWNGYRVRQAPVLFIAAEGGALFANRLAARRAHFMVLRGSLTLTGQNTPAPALAAALNHLSEIHGPFGMIVVDTVARAMGKADENAASDIADLLRNVDTLRHQTGAHVMLIHHSGKDASRGARGHSSLRAAVDTEIELTKGDDGSRMARVTKQRDMAGGAENHFTLEQVTLGRDSDGEAVTSCVVKHEKGQTER